MLRAIGIDLGTTNCCVAITEEGVPRVIPNRAGYRTTPSVVTVLPDNVRHVGRRALRQVLTKPAATIRASKRLLGRRFDSRETLTAQQQSTVTFVPGPDGETRLRVGRETLPVPMVSAMLLQEMRRVAEADLEESVDSAVITVPAYFTERQRQAVRTAGKIAGLKVLAILNEPTAAALSFGVRHAEVGTFAVYDLGGGTFDISIVRTLANQHVQVLSSTGDAFLGGEDFDHRIVVELLRQVQEAHGVDLSDNQIAVQRLRMAAERARCDLSSVERTVIRLPYLMAATETTERIDLDFELSRETFDHLTKDLVQRTRDICNEALDAAGVSANAVDEVLLVGGMTRTPSIRSAIRDLFGKSPSQRIHPDEAVALGAALHAAALVGQDTSSSLDDVTAHPLGVATAGGGCEVLIPANARLPASREKIFTTYRDDQTAIKIAVLQGHSTRAHDNELIGQFRISALPPGPAGRIEINVSFHIDSEGLFSASATNIATGDEHEIAIIPEGLDEQDVERFTAVENEVEKSSKVAEEVEAARQRLDILLSETTRMIGRARRVGIIPPGSNTVLEKAERVVALMHESLRENPGQDMTREAMVLERLQQTIQSMLQG
jgi:molecular chaperone DnaK